MFRVRESETVQVNLRENEQTLNVTGNNGNNEEKDLMTVEVLGEMPKVIVFEQESTFQVKFYFYSVELKLLFGFIKIYIIIVLLLVLNNVNFTN